jgi:hypothetical protein
MTFFKFFDVRRPFHHFGGGKYVALGKVYAWEHVPVPDDKHMEGFRRLIESHGFRAGIGS